ncbi:MAG: hypothetical protein ACK5LC_08670 [Coprobacillaceae bacterium]
MKSIIVATAEGEKLDKKQRKKIEKIAKQENGVPMGVIEYPEGLLFIEPGIMIETLDEANIDIVIATNEEFMIKEILTNGNLSKMFADKGIKIIEANYNLELNEAYQTIPSAFKNHLQAMDKERSSSTTDRKNILIVTQEDMDNFMGYVEELFSEDNIQMAAVAKIPDYIPEMNDEIRDIIKKQEIDMVAIYGDIPKQLKVFIEELSEEGITIIDNEKQTLESTYKNSISGMKLN